MSKTPSTTARQCYRLVQDGQEVDRRHPAAKRESTDTLGSIAAQRRVAPKLLGVLVHGELSRTREK